MSMTKSTFNISGMSCVNCAARIEKSLSATVGIDTAVVNFATEELAVEYDEATSSREQIAARVRELGYGITAIAPSGELRFGVRGLHCASCVATLESRLLSH